MENIYDRIVFKEMPIFFDNFKNKLKEENNFKIIDYLEVFLEYFEFDNSYNFFEKNLVLDDQFTISVKINQNNYRIHFIRCLHLNSDFDKQFLYESYKIQLNLNLQVSELTAKKVGQGEYYQINKKENGKYKINSFDKNYTDLEVFKTKICSSQLIKETLHLKPISLELNLNADV